VNEVIVLAIMIYSSQPYGAHTGIIRGSYGAWTQVCQHYAPR